IVTTLCNIFFTTSKNVVKIIRQSWSSITEALKILFLNPDNLLFGERMKAVAKIISLGASVVLGSVIEELVSKSGIGTVPIIGEIVPTFCGALFSGIMSCSLLMYIDRSPKVQELVRVLDNVPTISKIVDYYKIQADYFEQYSCQLMQIDIETFKKEVSLYKDAIISIDKCKDQYELGHLLDSIMRTMNIKKSWQGDFDEFMGNRENRLVFE
ncbi:MAG: hypothetical protein R3Y52_03655, partial [Psittacicella sp.]